MRLKNFVFILSLISACALFVSTTYANDPPSTAQTSKEVNAADKNKLVGQAFLSKNMTNPGVVTLSDGLQYKVIKQGQGDRPAANDMVTVNYSGKLINGTEFDSSYKRGEPAKFRLNEVIPGWTEALQRMSKGAVWELYVPASLAYGERGMPPVIGPNETLIFKVELLDISK